MSILVYAETENGKLKKNALELASYAGALANTLGAQVVAMTIGAENASELGKYGVNKVLNVTQSELSSFNAQAYASALTQALQSEGATVALIGSSADSKYMAPLFAAQANASYVPNVVEQPLSTSPFQVKRTAFSNKGFAITEMSADVKVIGVASNSFGLQEKETACEVTDFNVNLGDGDFKTKSVEVDKVVGKATIADADIVVSAGRGLKGPENWGMIEEMADILGAATACSKPVSDLGWRPHGEHVGQTGKPVATNLYFAIGISGAIQHLAGVSASKVKVVINTDPEAPFFKAADYGVVGDAFEVVPQLIEKLKEFKAQNA
ncbi:electron transfer flavoprotein subunit alpha/FixB family protein [Aureicoccus marinus]|jgi:electron transfer flavoprotein alpha subunit|uniref:Electron transfer flavoprotein subunit alpha n=1 Tax=Aureicoccus marinus TaxID=754435 RepID=A0A2S7T748_9FLAO|nr:electron transfer flavoprotein subunit alpha/FixB family protein [Aureicoccus marinus]PQJ15743.1 electron transfer flavoprotein subunit alpha [Aureicoccus marinus]